MIEFKHVSLTYPYENYALLKDLDFVLIDGTNTVLCDSQSGKTSICKLLTKEFAATSGQIVLNGQDITSITNADLGILYLTNKPAFFERRTVRYNVTYPLRVRKVPKVQLNERFEEVARQVGLDNAEIKVNKLTVSERKRVALARGLTVSRKTVLLDDFCDDPGELDEVLSLFGEVTTVILTSDVNLSRGNVVLLDGGNTVYVGDAAGATEYRKQLGWISDILRSE